MCRSFEELAEKRADEKANERAIEIAKKMLEDGSISVEKVAMFSNLPLETVEKLVNLQSV